MVFFFFLQLCIDYVVYNDSHIGKDNNCVIAYHILVCNVSSATEGII